MIQISFCRIHFFCICFATIASLISIDSCCSQEPETLQPLANAVQLFDGQNLDGWMYFSNDDDSEVQNVWSVENGVLKCKGSPAGYLQTKRWYRDYQLEFEWRWPGGKGGNSGVLIHTSTPLVFYGWPKSIEVQLHTGSAGDFWVICDGVDLRVKDEASRRPKPKAGDQHSHRRIRRLPGDLEKPVGQWNKMKVVCRGKEIKVWVNDQLANHATDCTVTEGAIAFQSEGTSVEFREIALKPLETNESKAEQGSKKEKSHAKEAAVPATLPASKSDANNWTQFRGPNGNGVVEAIKHPLQWSDTENVAWKVEIPGGGWSSPVVVGDKIFLTNAAGPMTPVGFRQGVANMRSTKPDSPLTFQAICLNLKDGSTVWETPFGKQMPEFGIHPSNSFATATPVTDGKNLFVYFASAGIVAGLDLNGKKLWKKEIGAYPTGNGFGPGSSLAIHGDNIFVQCDNDKESFIVALKKSSGDEAWRKQRKSRTSWSTPLVWKNQNRTELIACGSGFATAYNPETGDEFWTVSGISSAFSASPASDNKRIYLGNSGPRSSGPLLSINSSISGQHKFEPDTEFEGLAWSKMQAGPGMPSPVAVGGYLYVTGRGTLSCYSSKDGKQLYKTRVNGMKSAAASFWADKERLLILDEAGTTFVVQVGSEYKLVGTNKIDDLFWSTPSVAGQSLLMRSATKLYCIRKE